MSKYLLFSLLGIILFSSIGNCQNTGSTISYFFCGHTEKRNSGDRVDERIESLDLSGFEGCWLGGDMCIATLLNYSTIPYLNSIFDLKNPETHWALGNHDYRNGNLEWLEEYTSRESFYAYSSHSITRIILNTNIVPTQCELLNKQFGLIKSVCDTIVKSKHLFLIMHHGLFESVPGLPSPTMVGHSNLIYWNSNCYDVNSNFINSIYPMLLEVKNRGIKVYYLYGDMGAQMKHFDVYSTDSIRFLGCGLYFGDSEDEILIINKDRFSDNLEIEFHNLDSLQLQLSK